MALILDGTSGITSPGGDTSAVSVTTPLVTNAGTLDLSATGANIVAVSTNGAERMRIDSSFLVATLTAAIQEQQAIIEQLKADVAALKGAQA